jgi:hypothetical protein
MGVTILAAALQEVVTATLKAKRVEGLLLKWLQANCEFEIGSSADRRDIETAHACDRTLDSSGGTLGGHSIR